MEIYELDPNLSDVENIDALLEREQPWLDWLFSLPEQFRYNFASVAEASFKGLTHTPETKALISASMTGKSPSDETRAKISEAHKGLQSGENNPMYGRTHTPETLVKISASMTGKTHTPETVSKMSDSQQLVDRSGANNPMYGKVPTNAMTINIYSLDGKLINSFSSQVAAANWVNIPRSTFQVYLKSGKVWNNLYTFRKSSS